MSEINISTVHQEWQRESEEQPIESLGRRLTSLTGTALATGNTRSLSELFRIAGARFAFDRSTISELASLIDQRLARLDT